MDFPIPASNGCPSAPFVGRHFSPLLGRPSPSPLGFRAISPLAQHVCTPYTPGSSIPLQTLRGISDFAWLKAASGKSNAQFKYVKDVGIEADPAQAVVWYSREADAGNKYALCYKDGFVVERRGTSKGAVLAVTVTLRRLLLCHAAEAGNTKNLVYWGSMIGWGKFAFGKFDPCN